MTVPSLLIITSRSASGRRVPRRPEYSTEQRATIRRTSGHDTSTRGRAVSAVLLALAVMAPAPACAAGSVTAASIGVKMETTPCPVAPDALGCFDAASRTIHWTDGNRRTLEHELAHAWEREHLTDADRAYLSRRYLGGGPWFRPPRPCGFDPSQTCATPSAGERFAEAWTFCRYPFRPGRFVEAEYGYDPLAHQRQRRLCNTILLLQLARG